MSLDAASRRAIASLGKRLGAAKRRGCGYVYLPVDIAQGVHKVLCAMSKAEYQKEYRKL
jgi:hypothetical protein